MRTIELGSPGITRAFFDHGDARAVDPGQPMKFVASTDGIKRDGLDLKLDGLDTTNFERNPVFLWVHNYAMPPLGKVVRIRKLKKRLEMWVQFDQDDDFAVDIERKYREGYLTAVSIGWIITEYERGVEGETEADYIITRSDLLDLSAVPVPGDPDALMPRELAAVRSMASTRSPVGDDAELPAHGPHTSSSTGTLGTVTIGDKTYQLSRDALEGANKMFDMREQDDDPCASHTDDDGDVDWTRVAAEMARLLDDGTIDDATRETQYRHLTRHYRQSKRTPPELLAGSVLADIDVRDLFVEGEWAIHQTEVMMETTEQARQAIAAMRAAADTLEAALDVDEEVAPPETENRSFVDALGSIRDAIVLPDDIEGDDTDE